MLGLFSTYKRPESAVLLLSLLIPMVILVSSWSTPIVDSYGFRQTQTALTSYWISKSTNWLEFITPVFGHPWSVPMEYPIFQILVNLLSSGTSISLENAARIISVAAFYSAMWSFKSLLGGTLRDHRVFYAFYLSSPILGFYSSRVLIESFSFFLCITVLSAFVVLINRVTLKNMSFFVFMCVLAGLQKITGLMSVLIGCGVYSLFFLVAQDKKRAVILASQLGVLVAFAVAIPVGWVLYSDDYKTQYYVTSFLSSDSLSSWNYGNLLQRLNPYYLAKVFGFRMVLLGGVAILLLRCLLYKFRPFSANAIAISSLAAGISGPLIFFNLYLVHEYYLVASVGFVGLGLYLLVNPKVYRFKRIRIPSSYLVAGTLSVNLLMLSFWYMPKIGVIPPSHAAMYSVALKLKEVVRPDEVILTVGVDWDSTIPYFSQRYAIMLPSWHLNDYTPVSEGEYFSPLAVLENIEFYLAGRNLGAIVICKTRAASDDILAVDYILDTWKLDWQEDGECRYGINYEY